MTLSVSSAYKGSGATVVVGTIRGLSQRRPIGTYVASDINAPGAQTPSARVFARMRIAPPDPPRVGILDDDLSMRRALTLLLRSHGFSVQVFASAGSLLRRAAAGLLECDVLVLDVHLGKTNGFAVHDALKAAGNTSPMIFITGRDEPAVRARLSRIRAAGYLIKPFDGAALIAAVQAALAAST